MVTELSPELDQVLLSVVLSCFAADGPLRPALFHFFFFSPHSLIPHAEFPFRFLPTACIPHADLVLGVGTFIIYLAALLRHVTLHHVDNALKHLPLMSEISP